MSDLYDQIVRQRGSFENLLARIPGFRGYLEKASRRTADQMLREYIAAQLHQRVKRYVMVEEKVLRLEDGLGHMARMSDVKSKLQLYRDRISSAVPEFGGFAAAVKVDDEALDRIYAFDEAQVRYLDQIDNALDALENAVDEAVTPLVEGDARTFDAELAALEQLIREAQDAFDLRDQVLTSLHKTYSN